MARHTAGGTVASPVAPPATPASPAPPVNAGVNSQMLRATLVAAGRANQSIHFNPNAAIQKCIFADGFVPNSSEFTVESGGLRFVGHQAEHLHTGEVQVYYVQEGLWDNVRFVGQAAG